jgi:hypothetical protein
LGSSGSALRCFVRANEMSGFNSMLYFLTLDPEFWMSSVMPNHKDSNQIFIDDLVENRKRESMHKASSDITTNWAVNQRIKPDSFYRFIDFSSEAIS